jgi:hypothetical protein
MRLVLTIMLVLVGSKSPATGMVTNYQHAVFPLIRMEEVPLHDAVKNLARQDGINFIFDPAVLDSFEGPDGRSTREPQINASWTNVTAAQALKDVLRAYGLSMVTNPVTTVARISFPQQKVMPVSADQLGTDTTAVIPLISIEEVPLIDGIKNLAHEAKISYILDPTINSPSAQWEHRALLRRLVNLRWLNITSKQALVALLDDYGLMMVQDPGDIAARIVVKPGYGPSRQGNHGGGGQPQIKSGNNLGYGPQPGPSTKDHFS